jgi:nucleotidyltransferase substrate binding protein (TIGR01987 family)
MEKIETRYALFIKALGTLETALTKFEKLEPRDSVIQRFEYSIDSFWKLLKEYLEVHHGVAATGSPKMTLKNCVDVTLITPVEYKECLEMIDDRNLSSHAYNVILADEIAQAIPHYYTLMKVIAQRI